VCWHLSVRHIASRSVGVSGCAGDRGTCSSGAVIESGSTSCVEQNFNNIGPFIIRPVIFTVVLIQHEQCEGRGRPDTPLK
jgi:hypothetical protein